MLTVPVTTDHPSELELHRLLLGQLPPEAEARVAPHAAACPRCQEAVAELRSGEEQFAGAVFGRTVAALADRHRARRPWFRWVWLVPVPLVAAGALLFFGMRSPGPDGPRVKGAGSAVAAPGLAIYARRGERLFPVASGEVVRPGDELRFVVSRPPGFTHALVVAVAADGRVEVYYPPGKREAGELPGLAPRVELPGTLLVDDRPSRERVHLLLDRAPFTLATVLPTLRAPDAASAPLPVDARVRTAAATSVLLERSNR